MEPDITEISEREKEILALVATGATNQQIARALHISPNTVKVHLRNIFGKLGVESRTEAAFYAVQQGWVRLPGAEAVVPEGIAGPAMAPPPRIGPLRRAFFILSLVIVILALWLPYPGTGQDQSRHKDFTEAPAIPATTGPYLPRASRWRSLAQMPTPRGRLAVVALEQRIYAIGGASEQGITGRVEVYDVPTDSWSNASPLPTPAANIQAAALERKIYIPGGYAADGTFLDALQVYHPDAGVWTTAQRLPSPLAGYALAVHEGRLYLFGGSDGQGYRNDAFRYDPGTDQWEALPPMPTRRGFAGAGVVEDQIYVVGGYDGAHELSICERFDPAGEGWLPCAPLTTPRGGLALATFGETLYAIGGGWEHYLAFNEKYSRATDSWTTFETPILSEWRLLGTATLGPYIYALGGVSGRYLSANQAYQAQFRIILPVGP
ncbi:MAG: Kelch repeat-containing protein [Anaerolineae bacterium]